MNEMITNLGIADQTSLIIVILLPLTAGMLVSQTNPYNALVIRGIVGAIAALVYALFGAADVALTEAFVGTMLSTMLYVVAVRSSMTMRVGCLETLAPREKQAEHPYSALLKNLRTQLKPHHLRLEIMTYQTLPALEQAMSTEEIHTVITDLVIRRQGSGQRFQIQTRLERLCQLMNQPSINAIAEVSLHQPLVISPEIGGGE